MGIGKLTRLNSPILKSRTIVRRRHLMDLHEKGSIDSLAWIAWGSAIPFSAENYIQRELLIFVFRGC